MISFCYFTVAQNFFVAKPVVEKLIFLIEQPREKTNKMFQKNGEVKIICSMLLIYYNIIFILCQMRPGFGKGENAPLPLSGAP